MRLWAILSLALFLLSLVLARFLPEPLWRLALYPIPLLLMSTVVAAAATFLEFQLGPHFRSVAPVLAAALALFCLLYALFERPPGTLGEGLILENLGEKAASIAALGAGLCAVGLAIHGARAPSRSAQLVAAVSVVATAVALSDTVRAVGLPTLPTVSLLLLGTSGVLFLLSQAPREQPEEASSEDAVEPPPGPP